jgi:hypothetical protein
MPIHRETTLLVRGFRGPDYVKGSMDSNGLWMDRVILERLSKNEKADVGG